MNAFRATLEELREADLLVHVLDASNPDWPRQRAAVERSCTNSSSIGRRACSSSTNATCRRRRAAELHGALYVSAATGAGLDALARGTRRAHRIAGVTRLLGACLALSLVGEPPARATATTRWSRRRGGITAVGRAADA